MLPLMAFLLLTHSDMKRRKMRKRDEEVKIDFGNLINRQASQKQLIVVEVFIFFGKLKRHKKFCYCHQHQFGSEYNSKLWEFQSENEVLKMWSSTRERHN